MQTFLPYADFDKSAKCLDVKRLGKQRLECMGIWQIIRNPESTSRWRNHPAVKMWKGYGWALSEYWSYIQTEWIIRGYKVGEVLKVALWESGKDYPDETYLGQFPPWLGNEAFHAAHRSNLLRKNPAWYGQYGWTEPVNLPYVWPVENL